MFGAFKRNVTMLGAGAACGLMAAPLLPMTQLKWPVMLATGPAVVKAGLAVKFLTVTAAVAGAGLLVYGLSKADIKGQARKTADWVRGIGHDDEWDRFFETENGG